MWREWWRNTRLAIQFSIELVKIAIDEDVRRMALEEGVFRESRRSSKK